MIDLILILILAFLLYRAASRHGISALPYVLNYITGAILASIVVCCVFIHFYGIAIFQIQPDIKITDPNVKPLLMFEAISLISEITLFFYLKWRIENVEFQPADEDDSHHDAPQPPKKDLSYFR